MVDGGLHPPLPDTSSTPYIHIDSQFGTHLNSSAPLKAAPLLLDSLKLIFVPRILLIVACSYLWCTTIVTCWTPLRCLLDFLALTLWELVEILPDCMQKAMGDSSSEEYVPKMEKSLAK